MNSLKYIAIIVFYYPDYFEKSSLRFKKMIANNCKNEILTVAVNNNPSNISEIKGFDVVLDGKITSSEFYAWDLAINYLRNEGYELDGVSFLLANDTFCKHRYYSSIHEKTFFRSIKNIGLLKSPILIGETNSLGSSYSILGLHSGCWVSTYLFSFNYAFLSKMKNIVLSESSFSSCLSVQSDGRVFWTKRISSNLKNHINNWVDNNWYKKDLVKKDLELKRWKLHSILNEKYLSAYCIQTGGALKDPYRQNLILFLYFRFLCKAYSFFRLRK